MAQVPGVHRVIPIGCGERAMGSLQDIRLRSGLLLLVFGLGHVLVHTWLLPIVRVHVQAEETVLGAATAQEDTVKEEL